MNIIPKETGKEFVRHLNSENNFDLVQCQAVVYLLNNHEQEFVDFFQHVYEVIQDTYNNFYASDDEDDIDDDGDGTFGDGMNDNTEELYNMIIDLTSEDNNIILDETGYKILNFLSDYNDLRDEENKEIIFDDFFVGIVDFIFFCNANEQEGLEFPGIGLISIEY